MTKRKHTQEANGSGEDNLTEEEASSNKDFEPKQKEAKNGRMQMQLANDDCALVASSGKLELDDEQSKKSFSEDTSDDASINEETKRGFEAEQKNVEHMKDRRSLLKRLEEDLAAAEQYHQAILHLSQTDTKSPTGLAYFPREARAAFETLKRNLTFFDPKKLEDHIGRLEAAAMEQATAVELIVLGAQLMEEKIGRQLDKAGKALGLLIHLSTLCNNTEETETRTGNTRSQGPRDEDRKHEILGPNWDYSEGPIDELFRNKDEVNLTGSFDENDKTKLRDLSSFMAGIIRKSKPLKRISKGTSEEIKAAYKRKVESTVDAILSYGGEGVVEVEESLYIPIPPGQEVTAVQPILTAFLRLMADLVENSRIQKKNPSPSKGVQEERYIEPPNSSSRWRKADVVLSKDGKSFPFELRSLLSLLEEIKPLGRKSETLSKILCQVMDQQLGHQAKRLLYAFDFGGVGVDAHCTGIVMTMAHIEVVQLAFERDSFEVKLRSTGKLPLFPRDCIEKLLDWDCSREQKTEIEKFLAELFPDSSDDSTSGSSAPSHIPEGLVTLWKLLNTSSSDLFKDYWKGGRYSAGVVGSKTYELGERLGSGTFGEVYSVTEDKESVIKVAKSGQSPAIRVEIETLKSLKSEHAHVPKFVSEGSLSVSIHNQTVELPALMTSPRGFANTHQLRITTDLPLEQLYVVAKHMLSALEYAHSKKLCHLDVRPSNIVLTNSKSPSELYLLVDWGCSRKMGENVNGFIGSENYAHDQVHVMYAEKRSWKPVAELDKASLLYTLVVLHNNGRVPWKHTGTSLLECRKKKVKEMTDDWKLENLQDLKDAAVWTKS